MASIFRCYRLPLLILVAAALCLRPLWFANHGDSVLRAASYAHYTEDFPNALRLANAVLEESPRVIRETGNDISVREAIVPSDITF